MPSHTPAARPARSRTPSRLIVGKKESGEEMSARPTALSPNRSVSSPAPGVGEEQASPYSRRDRVKKRVSDEAVGGIESLIPKARKSTAGSVSPYAQRTVTNNNSTGKSLVRTPETNGSIISAEMRAESPNTTSRRGGRKSMKTESGSTEISNQDMDMSDIALPSPVMPPTDGSSNVVRSSPQKPVASDTPSSRIPPSCAVRLDTHMSNASLPVPTNGTHVHISQTNGDIPANSRPVGAEEMNKTQTMNGHSVHNGKYSVVDGSVGETSCDKPETCQESVIHGEGDRWLGEAGEAADSGGPQSSANMPMPAGSLSSSTSATTSEGATPILKDTMPKETAPASGVPQAKTFHAQFSTSIATHADVEMADAHRSHQDHDANLCEKSSGTVESQNVPASSPAAPHAHGEVQAVCAHNSSTMGPASEGKPHACFYAVLCLATLCNRPPAVPCKIIDYPNFGYVFSSSGDKISTVGIEKIEVRYVDASG
jgi:hypothetical protein